MQIHHIQGLKRPVRIGILGSSNLSALEAALQMGYCLTGDWADVTLIDSEAKGHLLSHIGGFTCISLSSLSHPSKWMDAIELAESAGKKALVLQGVSSTFIQQVGDPEEATWQASLLDHIRNSYSHIVALLEPYSGTEPTLCRCFHTLLQLGQEGTASATRDDTGFFALREWQSFTQDLMLGYSRWCRSGDLEKVCPKLQDRINRCMSLGDLLRLLFSTEVTTHAQMQAFTQRRLELEGVVPQSTTLETQPITSKPTYHEY